MKSPGDGLAPYYLDAIVGRVLLQPLEPDDNLTLDILGPDEAG